jgi:hypothetical protein
MYNLDPSMQHIRAIEPAALQRENADDERQFYCSFCGKSKAEVQHLHRGPSVFICDECVAACVEEEIQDPAFRS